MRRYRGLLIFALAGLLVGGSVVALTHRAAQAQDPSPPDPTLATHMGSAHFGLYWNVVGNGGGAMSSAHFRIRSTIGQPAIGWKTSTHFEEHTGYWQQFTYRVYLPLVLRNYSS